MPTSRPNFFRMLIPLLTALVLVATACSGPTTPPRNDASSLTKANGQNDLYQSLSTIHSLHQALPPQVKSSGVLRLVAEVPQPPYWMYKPNGHDGYRGLDYDLARGVAKILGLQVNVQTTQFAGLMPALQAHKADIAWVGWLPTPERLKSANFITYLAVPWGVLVRKGNPKGIHALADLCGKTVALLQGTQPPIKLINDTQQKCTTLNKPHIHKLLVPKRQSVVLAVKSRKADAFFSAGTITAFFAKTIDNGQTFTSIANPKGVPPHSVYPQGLAIAKDNSQLLTVTDKALTRLMKSPVYDSILTKYGLQDFGLQTPTVKT